MSIGIVGGLGINVAHELIHKDGKLEPWAGGFLLSLVCYAGFKVEHLPCRGGTAFRVSLENAGVKPGLKAP